MSVFNKEAAAAIEEAARLNRAIKDATERLNELKVIIRAEASAIAIKRGDDEKVEFESDEGVGTIVFVDDAFKLVKDAVPTDLKDALPKATWEALFNEKVVLSEGFDDTFNQLPSTQKKLVGKLVELKPTEPRVILPK